MFAGALCALMMFGLAGEAKALTPVPEEPPMTPVTGTPLFATTVEALDIMAKDAGYVKVEGSIDGLVRKYVRVTGRWVLEYIVLTDKFISWSSFDLTSDMCGAITGYQVAVENGNILAEHGGWLDWFEPEALPEPEPPAPEPDPCR